MACWYGRAGCLTSQAGGCRPGQYATRPPRRCPRAPRRRRRAAEHGGRGSQGVPQSLRRCAASPPPPVLHGLHSRSPSSVSPPFEGPCARLPRGSYTQRRSEPVKSLFQSVDCLVLTHLHSIQAPTRGTTRGSWVGSAPGLLTQGGQGGQGGQPAPLTALSARRTPPTPHRSICMRSSGLAERELSPSRSAPRTRAWGSPPSTSTTARARPGRFSALGVFLCNSVLYGWVAGARGARNSRKWWFPARAVTGALSPSGLPVVPQASPAWLELDPSGSYLVPTHARAA
jgi:hypothetical protein